MKAIKKTIEAQRPTFIDVFAGCGGFSLGLMRAGWKGLFAIEKDINAFETLRTNLVGASQRYMYEWPKWMASEARTVGTVIRNHRKQLINLRGRVDMLVGGPPCQGFSTAGRRDPNDPRNKLTSDYLQLVRLLQPKVVLLENVRGFTVDFVGNDVAEGRVNYAGRLREALSKEYVVFDRMIDVSRFGVPQRRMRFFLIALRRDLATSENPFDLLETNRSTFLRQKGICGKVSAKSAISDLEVKRNGVGPSSDTDGFFDIQYQKPLTSYQKLMHNDCVRAPADTRLARHRPDISTRFEKIISLCHSRGRLNTSLDTDTRRKFGLKKCALRVLDPDQPSPTITSMPDDLLHYSEPRTLTVRENARLQSFPDWFSFRGKYTTGGDRRRKEVPRFTQVANAVPPLIAEALGYVLVRLLRT